MGRFGTGHDNDGKSHRYYKPESGARDDSNNPVTFADVDDFSYSKEDETFAHEKSDSINEKYYDKTIGENYEVDDTGAYEEPDDESHAELYEEHKQTSEQNNSSEHEKHNEDNKRTSEQNSTSEHDKIKEQQDKAQKIREKAEKYDEAVDEMNDVLLNDDLVEEAKIDLLLEIKSVYSDVLESEDKRDLNHEISMLRDKVSIRRKEKATSEQKVRKDIRKENSKKVETEMKEKFKSARERRRDEIRNRGGTAKKNLKKSSIINSKSFKKKPNIDKDSVFRLNGYLARSK